jgi:hypothetical protein
VAVGVSFSIAWEPGGFPSQLTGIIVPAVFPSTRPAGTRCPCHVGDPVLRQLGRGFLSFGHQKDTGALFRLQATGWPYLELIHPSTAVTGLISSMLLDQR